MKITTPHRASRDYTQRLHASPDRVFPLLCPVREVDWVRGWEPGLVISDSGVAEAGCVFTTPADQGDAVWVVTEHDPPNGIVGFVKVTPGETVAQIRIRLDAVGDDTFAHVTYKLTSLGEAGDRVVDAFTEAYYDDFMREWQAELNHYLATGRKLGDATGVGE